jgi:lipooligosaccharide transport system permease protein
VNKEFAAAPPSRKSGIWFPHLSSRVFAVWRRDFDVFRRLFWVNFAVPMLEPILYLLALGFGLGLFVKEIQGIPYPRFIAPGLISVAIMYGSFFECSYASFVRMYYQKTFDAIIATPLNLEEVVAGEILWGATRATINATVVFLVVMAFGLSSPLHLAGLLPLAFLGGILFGSLGMISTALVPGIEYFNIPIFLFLTPMFLFSGTFFPLEVLPQAAQKASYALLPLTHTVKIARSLMLSRHDVGLLGSLLWMGVVALVAFLLALYLMQRRLIK